MSKERITMRKIREILRLKYEKGISKNKAADICHMARSTVQEYVRRFEISDLAWPLPDDISDEELESKLYSKDQTAKKSNKAPLDYTYLMQELRKPNMTIEVLWSEYKEADPLGYNYSYFCQLLRAHQKKCRYSMRQIHKGGEKTFVDFGTGLDIIDPQTGEKVSTKLFISTWGASNYLFVKAVLHEDLPSWIKINVDALNYFGCCSHVMVPDNLKAAVTKACRYEPQLNPTYLEFAQHYSTTIIPARPRKPKDKSKAENSVKLAKRWILARLRNHIFTSLTQLNDAIAELLESFNHRIMKKTGKSRKELFELLDKPHAITLPDQAYVYADWKWATVNINYHINYDQHDYSVPYHLGTGTKIAIRATATTVEIYQQSHRMSKRLCSHLRSYRQHGYTTVAEHMPPSHRQYLEWTPERILSWAGKIGPQVKAVVEKVMQRPVHKEQSYKSCLGIIRLAKHYSHADLNAACQRALDYRVYTYQAIKSILSKQLQPQSPAAKVSKKNDHENVRGSNYYAQSTTSIN